MKYKNTIRKVLDKHAESQINLGSPAARDLLAEQIARELIKKGWSYKPKRRWEQSDKELIKQERYREWHAKHPEKGDS